MNMEKPIMIAAKLLDRRNLAKEIFGDEYDRRIQRADKFMRDWMQSYGLDPIEALLEVLRVMKEVRVHDSAIAELEVTAAVFDMYENPTPTGQAAGSGLPATAAEAGR